MNVKSLSSAIENAFTKINATSSGKSEFIANLAGFLANYDAEASSDQLPQVSQLEPMLSSKGTPIDLAQVLQKHLTPIIEEASRDPEVASLMSDVFQKSKATKSALATASTEQKQITLLAMAAALRDPDNQKVILECNKSDVQKAVDKNVGDAKLNRLTVTADGINAMADSYETIAKQADPINRVIETWKNENNGLTFEKVTVPLGVIGMIYEARPNVTADAAGICLMSGNPVVLRPGSDCYETSQAIANVLQGAMESSGMPKDAVQIVPTTDRAAVGEMLKARGNIDLIIPRGGISLTQRVFDEARVPTLLHLDGNCHTYVDKDADADTAIKVVLNAKLRRTGICGATESLVIHKDRAHDLLPKLAETLSINGCELVGDERACETAGEYIKPAEAGDFKKEFLDKKLSVQIVDSVEEAVDVINTNSSKHTESIITTSDDSKELFTSSIKSAITMVNTSTQFADGGEFGFGAEIGISTGEQPPRGPVGAQQLVSFKYVVVSDGATRKGGPELVGLPD